MKPEPSIDTLAAKMIDAIRTNAEHFPTYIQSRGRSYLADGRVGPLEVVGQGFDAADDWIVAHAVRNDIVITGDIPLAARCLTRGVYALGPTGRPFTESNIGEALATRNLLSEVRGAGQTVGGPPPFDPRDRSRFLQALDRAIHGLRRMPTRRDGPGQPREV